MVIVRHISLVVFLFTAILIQAQTYPQKKQIKSGNYVEAADELTKLLEDRHHNIEANYAFYVLYSSPDYERYSLDDAYTYLISSMHSFNKAGGKRRKAAQQKGFSKAIYDRELTALGKTALQTADSQATIEAYNHFINHYKRCGKSRLRHAVKRRDELKSAQVAGSDWQTLTKYIQTHKLHPVVMRKIEGQAYDIIKSDPLVERIQWGAKNFTSVYRDSCWLQLMDFIDDCCPYNRYIEFINDPDYEQVDDTRKRMKYRSLQNIIRPYIEDRQWDKALDTALVYKDYFEGDRRYTALIETLRRDEDDIETVSISDSINHPSEEEYQPVITADGRHLYFCGRKKKDNMGGEDIFVSDFTDSTWTSPRLVGNINSSDKNEAPLAISADGTEMLLFISGDIYSVRKNADGWGEPQKLPATINMSEWQADATLTSDGNAMLFAAVKKTDYELCESVNIFVSLRQPDGTWGEPIELGRTINSPFVDRSPVLHPDMKTLYFCSKGHSSLGGLDVFVSKRLKDDSWTDWSEPVNLGKYVNTVDDEWGYKISTDGRYAYFAKSGDDYLDDIYRLTLPEDLRPEKVSTISGKLRDTQGQPVATTIRWEDMDTGQNIGQSHTDPGDGSFYIILPHGRKFIYYIDDENIFPVSANIDLTQTEESVTIESDVQVATIERMMEDETPMPLNSLFFNTGKAVLLPASASELDRVAKILTAHPHNIEISGHSDNTGSDLINDRLSQQRAEAVRNYLKNKGIPAKMMTAKGYGKHRPIADNNTEEGRRKNRRVEIKFIKQ